MASVTRVPKQARSRERVRRILDAAHQILVEEGYDALSLRRITEVAGVPVGTAYQFFADKNSIVRALVGRFLAECTAIMERESTAPHPMSWSEAVDARFDAFVELYRANPGLLVLWQSRHVSEPMLDGPRPSR